MDFLPKKGIMIMKKFGVILRNAVYILLLLAILVCQLIPFWTVPAAETTSASLLGVTGRQYVHGDLIEKLDEIAGGFTYQDISTPVLLTVVLSAFGILLGLKNSNGLLKGLLGLIVAAAGAYLWLAVPAYTLGVLGTVIFVLDIVLAVDAVAEIIAFLYRKPQDAGKKQFD